MDTGISARHARSCRYREGRCTCSPTFKAEVYDARVGKRIYKTFANLSTARRWRQDAYVGLRSGTLSADPGPTLTEAADRWLDAARAGIVRTRSVSDTSRPRFAATNRICGAGCCRRWGTSGCAT